jgi:membrane-associated phospholipid phosphatase
MNNSLFTKIFFILMSFITITEAQQTIHTKPDLYPFENFGNNILNSFKGNNLYFHLAGVVSTAVLVTSDADYYINKYFNEHEDYGNATIPVIRYALYFPFVVGGSLFAYGKLHKDDEAVGASYAVLQSSVIALGYNALLKSITGRPNPDWRHTEDMNSLSKTFRFGFLRGGVFWGWPSGHTSSTMAVVSALTSFYPDKTWLKVVGYSYVAYMILGVSSVNRGGMHWFSDAIAASLMSYAIGSTAGKYYRSKFRLDNTTINYFTFTISL